MDLLASLDINKLAGIAVLLCEALLIALGALGALFYRHRQVNKALMSVRRHMRADDPSRAAYKALVRKARAELHGRFQSQGLGDPDNAIDVTLPDGARPRQTVLQLWKAWLALEAKALTAPQETFWEDRAEGLERCLNGWRTAFDSLAARAAAPAEDAPQPEMASARGSRPEPAADRELYALRARVKELQAYKQHFTELHAHVLEERRANRAMRAQLNHALTEKDSARAMERVLDEYNLRRRGVDSFLDRADVDPLAYRVPTGPVQPSGPAVSARQEAIIDRSGERVQREYRNLQSTINQQRKLIGELKDKVAQAEFDRDQVRQYYHSRVNKLERANEQTQTSLEVLQTENSRQNRQIRRLTRKLKEYKDREVDREALEATIDRFATQAIEMQNRIASLEAEITQLEATALRSESDVGAPQGAGDAQPTPPNA